MLAGALGAVLAGGCGPSFQAVYECDVRFEHCYALDQTSATADAKKDCWREWLHVYTYGQSADRIEFAAARYSELSLDPTLPSEDTGMRPRRPRIVAAPLPTNAFAPPPNVAGDGNAQPPPPPPPAPNVGGDPPPPPRVAPVAAHAPGQECTAACADRWSACRHGCADGACDGCDRSYRACVPSCFQDVRQLPRSLR